VCLAWILLNAKTKVNFLGHFSSTSVLYQPLITRKKWVLGGLTWTRWVLFIILQNRDAI
jgi:hypothetical protein